MIPQNQSDGWINKHPKQSNFIEIYEQALTLDFCCKIIQKFENSDKIQPGKTGHGIDITKKDSQDIAISNFSDWKEIEKQILEVTFHHLKQYLRKYLFALVGAVSPSFIDPKTNQLITINHENFRELEGLWLNQLIQRIYRPTTINMQKYLQNKGGYHHWHSEIYPNSLSGDNESLHRVLLFQYYLNTIEEGGETEFYYQNLKVRAKAGRLIIAPAGFTHTHKGHIPISDDKYILTSWILFQDRKFIYGKV